MKTEVINHSLKMLQSVSEIIRETIGNTRAESGGLGFGSKQDMIVRKFVFDPRQGTNATYTLNSRFFNPIIQQLWEEEGLEPLMIAHSHPVSFPQPSAPDVEIGKKYLQRFELDILYFPIVMSRADQEDYQILPYAFSSLNQGETYMRLSSIEVMPDQWVSNIAPLVVPSPKKKEDKNEEVKENAPPPAIESPSIDYSRVEQAISITKMKRSHLLVIGTGGAASFCKQISRLSIGKLTMIDPDICGVENIPRQSFVLADAIASSPKVLALADEIKRINPEVIVNPIQADFTKMPEEILDELMKDVDIILMLTDSFQCQKFGNKVALKYKKMGIWAGYYTLSRAAELFFYIPGQTEACFRCAVSSRYEAQDKKKVKIASTSNTIFHSSLLDSYIGFIVLAMLHNDIDGFEFSHWFKKGFKHNLIQFKVSPTYNGIFKELHGDATEFFNFGAVWQEVVQETLINGYDHNCPDCASETLNILV